MDAYSGQQELEPVVADEGAVGGTELGLLGGSHGIPTQGTSIAHARALSPAKCSAATQPEKSKL